MTALIESRERAERTLALIELPRTPSPQPSELLRAAVDPDEPIGFGSEIGRLMPAAEAVSGGNPLRLWILPACVVAAGLVVAWSRGGFPQPELRSVQQALVDLPAEGGALLVAMALFVLGGLSLIPLELLVIGSGLALGLEAGGLVSLGGSLIAAVLGYAAGRVLGPNRLSRWMSRASFRIGQQLGAQGLKGIALMRVASLTTAGATHLLCGAGRVPFGAFLGGTVIGLAPSLIALTTLGVMLRKTVLAPSLWNAFVTMVMVVALLLMAFSVRAILVIRQFSPMHAGHRRGAEFG